MVQHPGAYQLYRDEQGTLWRVDSSVKPAPAGWVMVQEAYEPSGLLKPKYWGLPRWGWGIAG